MRQRTFGWVQNPANIDNLKNTVGVFVKGSKIHSELLDKKIPFLLKHNMVLEPNIFETYKDMLNNDVIELKYEDLKGKGAGSGGRKNAKCSGIIQAVITAQKNITITDSAGNSVKLKKPYTDDWTADGFLRWAISIGLLDYNDSKDTCKISKIGKKFIEANSKEETDKILGEAYLSYPPVVRILNLLKEQGHSTKFELGTNLGFIGEAGFTSISQNIWVSSFCDEKDPVQKSKIRSDEEGSSDKYARMICRWLCDIGWVKKTPKIVNEIYGGKQYTCEISQAYVITLKGLQNLKKAYGKSKSKRIPKIVFFEMLATKTSDIQYVRLRRASILQYINNKERTLIQIQDYLKSKNIDETIDCIKDDITGLINIGLTIIQKRDAYKLTDEIRNLKIPFNANVNKTDISLVKERVREKLLTLNHKYLALIDLSFGGKETNRDFEIQTIDLLTNELQYKGKRLGDSSKPDGIIYYDKNGLIIDNKAYSKGYTLPQHQRDEMIRYIQENIDRNPARNSTEWWNEFALEVNNFNFVFISSFFSGKIKEKLNNIYLSTGVKGAVLNSENLLYLAEKLKSGTISYPASFLLFNNNDEITF